MVGMVTLDAHLTTDLRTVEVAAEVTRIAVTAVLEVLLVATVSR